MRVLATWQPQWSKYYYINFCISMKSADVYFLQNILACLQCDHMTSLFINISPFKTVKNCPTGWKFAKVSSKFGQILNIPLVFTKLQKIGKSGYTARLLFQMFGSWYRTQAAIDIILVLFRCEHIVLFGIHLKRICILIDFPQVKGTS